MKIIITNKQTFSSKSGTEYVKAQFINPVNAATGELFASKAEFDKFGVSISELPVNLEVVKALEELDTYDVEFDQKGRLVGLKK